MKTTYFLIPIVILLFSQTTKIQEKKTVSINDQIDERLPVFPGRKEFDIYGGYKCIKGTPTGRFHLEFINDRHFLITPEGHGFISIGVTHTAAIKRTKHQKIDYLNEICDGDWDVANQKLSKQFQTWGYNSLGYDSPISTRTIYPYFASCHPTGKVSMWLRSKVKHPDVFSDEWKQEATQSIRKMMSRVENEDNLIGIYWTDMPSWDLKIAKRSVGKTWVDAIRELPENAPGKMRYKQYKNKLGANATDEGFMVIIAKEVYAHIGPVTRELAPNALIFGERYAGRALPWDIIQEALPWIDVISVQPSGAEFPKENFDRLYRESGKPIMICDHNSSFNTPQYNNVMWKTLSSVAEVGKAHQKYLITGFETPYLIGYNKCQYIDRFKPVVGQLKQGLIQSNGKPYHDLVELVSQNNWMVHSKFQE
ncbi:MAG: hypothetical protein AAFO07_18780 [Bacteroidota bacterium]